MKKISSWLILILFTSLIHLSHAQKSDFIATDSTISSGVKLISGNPRDNAQFIRLKKNNETKKYHPIQISEYGFKNGTVYESRSIPVSGQVKQVFLERLQQGRINLFYYTEKGIKTFFLERDSSNFLEVKKDGDFLRLIAEYTSDFDWKLNQVFQAKYNRNSLNKLISIYNNSRNKPLPFRRFGIVVGFNSASLIIPSITPIEQLIDISFNPSSSLTFGLFADLPIEMSDFSLNFGMNFLKSGFSSDSRRMQTDVDVVINYTSLNMPFLIRYTVPTLTWRFFFNVGAIYTYHLRNESNVYEALIAQDVVTINEVQLESLISRDMLGYSCGLGLQRNLNHKNIAAFELRFNQLTGKEDTLNKIHFEVLTSVSF